MAVPILMLDPTICIFVFGITFTFFPSTCFGLGVNIVGVCSFNPVCQGSLNGVSGSFKDVSRKFQECLKKVSRVFQDSFKGVSRKIEGYFKGDFSVFQGNLKELQSEFQGSFKAILRVFQ